MTDTKALAVLFRVDRSDPNQEVVAVFPEEPADSRYSMTCYVHIGQHGSCSFDWYLGKTRSATPEEYGPLKAELESIGYNLKVYKRMTAGHRDSFSKAIRS